ncbi:hypothetical protein EDB85DRAFT_1489329 [Lactarius pseudohatsudake]|nr:hypothetical protein EDB85DRAFT_1489329 [Lactarius pseudohatsudake]
MQIQKLSPFTNNARKTQNDAVADAESCGSWVDWCGGVVCNLERLVRLTGPETLDSAGASSLFFGPMPRAIPPDGVVRERGYLSGYGVTLDLKKLSRIDVPIAEISQRKTPRQHMPMMARSRLR